MSSSASSSVLPPVNQQAQHLSRWLSLKINSDYMYILIWVYKERWETSIFTITKAVVVIIIIMIGVVPPRHENMPNHLEDIINMHELCGIRDHINIYLLIQKTPKQSKRRIHIVPHAFRIILVWILNNVYKTIIIPSSQKPKRDEVQLFRLASNLTISSSFYWNKQMLYI